MQDTGRARLIRLANKLSKRLATQLTATRDLAQIYWEIGDELNKVYGVTTGRGATEGSISADEWDEIEQILGQSKAMLSGMRRVNKRYPTQAEWDVALAVNPTFTYHMQACDATGEPRAKTSYPVQVSMSLQEEVAETLGFDARVAVAVTVQSLTAAQVIKTWTKFQAKQERLAKLR